MTEPAVIEPSISSWDFVTDPISSLEVCTFDPRTSAPGVVTAVASSFAVSAGLAASAGGGVVGWLVGSFDGDFDGFGVG